MLETALRSGAWLRAGLKIPLQSQKEVVEAIQSSAEEVIIQDDDTARETNLYLTMWLPLRCLETSSCTAVWKMVGHSVSVNKQFLRTRAVKRGFWVMTPKATERFRTKGTRQKTRIESIVQITVLRFLSFERREATLSNFRLYWGNLGLPQWLSGKEFVCNARDSGSIPGLGRSTGGECGNSLQQFCLEILVARGAWQATVHRVAKSRTQLKWLKMLKRRVIGCLKLGRGE